MDTVLGTVGNEVFQGPQLFGHIQHQTMTLHPQCRGLPCLTIFSFHQAQKMGGKHKRGVSHIPDRGASTCSALGGWRAPNFRDDL